MTENIPLSFWFNKAEKPIPTPYTDTFDTSQIDNLSLDESRELINHIRDEQNLAMSRFFYVPFKTKFQVALERIYQHIAKLTNPNFIKTPIYITNNVTVNGFQLYETDGTDIITSDYYEKLILLADSKKVWTKEEWRNAMTDTCCTDWYKQDKHGECYGGYWKYPHDSEEYKNAWDLSFNESCEAMWELPFSKDLLLETIQIGCSNRQESVRYSNFICVWLERKREAIAKL